MADGVKSSLPTGAYNLRRRRQTKDAEGVECRRQFPLWVGGTWPEVWHPCEFSCQREQRQARLTMPSAAENALCEWRKERSGWVLAARKSQIAEYLSTRVRDPFFSVLECQLWTEVHLKGLTPAIGASPNFVLPQKVLSDSNTFLWCSLSRTRVYLIFIGATVVWFISLEIPMRWQNRNTDTLIFLFAVFTYSHHKRVRAVFESFRLVAYHINCFAHVGFRFNSRFNCVSEITVI